jgi:hypothetical protein
MVATVSGAPTLKQAQKLMVAGGLHVGVSFGDVTTDDKLLLHYLPYSTTQEGV